MLVSPEEIDSSIERKEENVALYLIADLAHEAWREELDRQAPGKGRRMGALSDQPWNLRLPYASIIAVVKDLRTVLPDKISDDLWGEPIISPEEITAGLLNENFLHLLNLAHEAWTEERVRQNGRPERSPSLSDRLNAASLLAVLKGLGFSPNDKVIGG